MRRSQFVSVTSYYWGYQIKDEEKGGAIACMREMKHANKALYGRSNGTGPLLRMILKVLNRV
jgi:hypothetical protein